MNGLQGGTHVVKMSVQQPKKVSTEEQGEILLFM
jgi:hypothetical protein